MQYFGTDALDAANLIMPLVFFISPNDPRMIGTLNRTIAELVSARLAAQHGLEAFFHQLFAHPINHGWAGFQLR